MKTLTLAAIGLSLLSTAMAHADTPGYDRPATEQTQKDRHEHVVYWANFFDNMSVEMKDLADAHSTAEMITKGDRHGQQERTQGKGMGQMD